MLCTALPSQGKVRFFLIHNTYLHVFVIIVAHIDCALLYTSYLNALVDRRLFRLKVKNCLNEQIWLEVIDSQPLINVFSSRFKPLCVGVDLQEFCIGFLI